MTKALTLLGRNK